MIQFDDAASGPRFEATRKTARRTLGLMDFDPSFGSWLTRRRKALGLSRPELARRVGCATVTLRKIEADERRPSREFATRLADSLGLSGEQQELFVRVARSELGVYRLPAPERPASRDLPGPLTPISTLPSPMTRLIGREPDLAALRGYLLKDHGRLLTLTGAPGVGKSRLALEVAVRVQEAYQDGACFLSLAPITNPELVPAAISQVLEIRLAAPVMRQLITHLRQRNLLLVLDEFEQVMPAAPLISELLAACPWLSVLVTSRQPLRLRGERQYAVTPLALPEAAGEELRPSWQPDELLDYPAVALFVERARAVQPDFAVTVENASAVAAICRRLDGLPLAIELAAARIRVLPPEALLDRLSGTWMLSMEGLRDMSQRQKTLRSAIGWSYQHLSTEEQALFRRLGVFLGGCSLAAAEAVCTLTVPMTMENGVGRDAQPDQAATTATTQPPRGFLEVVSELLDSSLVRRELGTGGELRLLMLDTIRDYALEQLAMAGEAETTRQWHGRYYAQLARQAEPELIGPQQATWFARLMADVHNLRAALTWALDSGDLAMAATMMTALRHFWIAQSHLDEARTWLSQTQEAIAASQAGLSPTLQARLCNAEGSVAFYQGDYEAAQSLFEAALAWAETDDPRSMAYTLDGLGAVAANMGRLDRARELSQRSLTLSQQVGDRWLSAITLINLGEIARLRGDLGGAVALYQESLALLRAVGDPSFTAVALHNLGQVAYNQGDLEQASAYQRESLNLAMGSADYRIVASNLEQLAGVSAAQGRPLAAAHLLGAAQALRHRHGVPVQGVDRQDYDRLLATTEMMLGETDFKAAFDQGQAMNLQQAVALAAV